MERYDYLFEMTEDIKECIKENFSEDEIKDGLENRAEWEEKLYDELWVADSVTGNASGSYTFNAYRAEEYIAHNWELLEEALSEFECDCNPIKKGAEWCDVTIRCYLLGGAISRALDELEEEAEKE